MSWDWKTYDQITQEISDRSAYLNHLIEEQDKVIEEIKQLKAKRELEGYGNMTEEETDAEIQLA